MEKYIILVENENYCNDFHCEIQITDDLYIAVITNEIHPDKSINAESSTECYTKVAKYILDLGKIISVMSTSETHKIQIFRSYIRIEEINRHLSKSGRDF